MSGPRESAFHMRLFTAIELPTEVREHLANATSQLLRRAIEHNVRKTATDNIHITLCFLGEVPDAQVPQLCDRFTTMTVEPATVFANGFLFFPTRGRVRIVAAGFGGETERLVQLHARVEAACIEMGFAAEPRSYQPHATIGRNSPGRYERVVGCLRNHEWKELWPGPSFQVHSFALMQSDLRPSGPVYTRVAHFPLELL